MAKILIADDEVEKQVYAELGKVHELTFAKSFAQAVAMSRKAHFDLLVCSGTLLYSLDTNSENGLKIDINEHLRNPIAILVSEAMGFGALWKAGLTATAFSRKDGSQAFAIDDMVPERLAASIDHCLPDHHRKMLIDHA